MDTLELNAWVYVCDNTPADEDARFDAMALVVAAGVPRDTAAELLARWSTQEGHRVVPAGDGMWRWDFGPNGNGHTVLA
ncbi:hypothetical protein [Paraburkholderia sp. MM6662-R1]|uniref:hypothetical protein n=1 Tax=Paraburkholderia sp. MM6662-R1 TaxID=2991066 RepID=UPI003D20ECD0